MIHFNSNFNLKSLLLAAALLLNVGVMWGYGYSRLTAKSNDYTMGWVAASTSSSKPSSFSTGEKSATTSDASNKSATLYAFYQANTGYHFVTWSNNSTDNPCSVSVSPGSWWGTNTSTITATFAANSYSVKFNGNGNTGGSTSSPQSFTYGTAQKLNANGFEKKYTVSFDANGGSSVSALTSSASFSGWATSSTGTVAYSDQKSVSNLTSTNGGEVNLYAKWGTQPSITLPNCTKSGYVLEGWYDGTTKVGVAEGSYTPSANITLTAHWIQQYPFTMSCNVNALNVDETKSSAFTFTYASNPTPHIADGTILSYDATNNALKGLKEGTTTIYFTQTATTTIQAGTSATYTITVCKITNTLAIKSAQTILVDGTIASVYSGKNSDATITPSISVESINSINNGDGQVISYDLNSNTITAHNAGVATLTLTQPATYKYTAAEKSIKVTVNKYDNAISIDGGGNSKTYTKSYDEGQSVALTATNTDYTGSPLMVTQTAGSAFATYYPDQKAFYTSHTAGTATWTVSQSENYKYKAATATFTANIGNAAETTCYLKNDGSEHSFSTGITDVNGHYDSSIPLDGTAFNHVITFDAKCNGYNYFVVQYSTDGSSWNDIENPDLTSDYKTYGPYNVPNGTNYIRFGAKTGATLKKWYTNIKVYQVTSLTADDVTYSSTRYPDAAPISANLVINWSESNGGDIRILCDNSKFTLGQTTITNTSCNGGTTTIPVSYTSTAAGTDVANITIYNNVRRITCTMTATTIKRDQSITWKSNIDQLAIGTTVENAATATTDGAVTLTSSNTDVIEVVDGNLVTKAAGKSTITAYKAGNDVYNEVTDTKEIEVTADLIQYIDWNQNLMNLQLGGNNVTLNASANSEVEGCSTNGQRAITYASSNEAVVKVVNANQIQIIGAGTATLTATQAGGLDADGHKYAATSAQKKVVVRDPSAACVNYVYQQSSEWSHDFGWNETTSDTQTKEIEFTGGEPAGYEFDYKGEYHQVAIKYFTGKMYVDEYINDGWKNIQSLGEPTVGTYKTASGTIDRAATKMRIRVEASTGYFYFKDLQVLLARYLESSGNNLTYTTKVGSPVSQTVNVKYSNIQDNLTITSSNSLFTVDKSDIEGSCGSIGNFDLKITYTPTAATNGSADESTIKVTDGKSTLEIKVSGTAEVTSREIVWDHTDPTDIYTIQSETLSATAQTTDGYHTAAGSVYFSLTSDSQDKAALSSSNVLSFTKAGTVQVMANTVTDAKYNPATTVTKTWNVAITPTAVVTLPTVAEEITYADGLTLSGITLNDGTAKNTVDNNLVEGSYAWTTPATVPSLGTNNYSVTFTPSNTDMYATCTGEVPVYVNRPYEVAFTGGDNTMDNESFKTDEQKALTANTLTKSITVSYNEDGGTTVDDNTQSATFTGWKDAANNSYTDEQEVKNLSTEGGVVTLTAQWNFAEVTLPSTTKTGYTFQGWNDGTNTYAAGATYTPTANVTLTAKWTADTYSITYDLAGGSLQDGVTNPESYTIETADFTLNNPSKTGYTFAGWTGTDLSEANTSVTIALGSTGNREYTATWTANTYTVTFAHGTDASGEMANQSFTYDVAQTLSPMDFTAPAYTVSFLGGFDGAAAIDAKTATSTFAHWSGNNTTYSDQQSVSNLTAEPNGTVALTAQWTKNSITLPYAPEYVGHSFLGWYNGDTKIGDANASYTPTESIELEAKWQIRQYTVEWKNYDGTILLTEQLDYKAEPSYSGETPTHPEDEQNTYTFSGWTPTIQLVTGNTYYTATFTAVPKPKKIKVYIDGVESEPTQSDWETIRTNTPNAIAITDDAEWAAEHTTNVLLNTNGAYTCVNFVATDGESLTIPVDFTADNATYVRPANSTYRWGTICLPYALESGNGVQLYKLNNADIDNHVLTFDPVDRVEPNTPAAFKLTEAGAYTFLGAKDAENHISIEKSDAHSIDYMGGDWQFVGTFKTIYISSTEGGAQNYYIANDLFWNANQNAENHVRIRTFRAYFAAPNLSAAPTRFTINVAEKTEEVTPVEPDEPQQTALDENKANNVAEKFFHNGVFYIRRNGHIFDLSGHLVK